MVLSVAWLLAAVSIASEPSVAAASEVRIGIVAFEDFRGEFDRSQKLLADLADGQHPRLKFRLAVGTYGDVAHWLKQGQIDIAIVAPGLLAELVGDNPGEIDAAPVVEYLASVGKPAATSPWASPARKTDGYHDAYHAVCVVTSSSSLRSMDDVRNAIEQGQVRVLSVHPASVSSRLAPAFALRQIGVDPEAAPIEYTHSHSASLRLVAESPARRQEVVAFVWDDALRNLSELAEAVRAIPFPELEQLAIPTDAVVARRGFAHAPRFKDLLAAHVDASGRHDFILLDDWRGRYAAVRRWKLAPAIDADDPQRVALDEIGRLLLHHARSQPQPPRVALVLSGGGAKCAYQAGAVAAIEETLTQVRRENPGTEIDLDLVVGTSGGAINAVPIALGVTRSADGRADFLEVWSQLDQRKIVRPAAIVQANIGLWFALAQAAVTLWIIRRFFPRREMRAWVFGGAFVGLASAEMVVRALDLAPWSWLGENHLLHHAWLWMSFGIGASAASVLLLGLATLGLQWRRVRCGAYLAISSRWAGWWLAAGLLGLPLVQVVTVLFFQDTLSGSEGIERVLADHFPKLIDRELARQSLKPLSAGAGKSPGLQLKAVSRQVIERHLLARDLVLTGSCLEQSTHLLPSDLYFFAARQSGGASPPFGPRGVPLVEYPGLLLDVVMGSGSIFPMFPARRLEDFPKSGEFVDLVDGGFAHNSPIEAAVLWGATHVILIEASPRERSGRDNFLQNAAASFDHLYEQSQLLDTRSRGKVAVFTLAPEAPHLCVLDFADNLIRAAVERGYRDASGHSPDGGASRGIPRFRKEFGEPIFSEVTAK